MVIKGTSMLPYLEEGDRVWLQMTEADRLQPGDLVAFELNQTIFTHRLIRKAPNFLLTKGDNCFFPDPSITLDRILGKVIAFEKDGKIYRLEGKRVGINRILGYGHFGVGLVGQTLLLILRWTQGRLKRPLIWIGRGALLPLKIIERILIYAS